MFGYNTAYIIVVFCLFLSLSKNKKLDASAYVVMGIVLVCLCGFRHVEYARFNDSYYYYQNFLTAYRSNYFAIEEYKDPAFLVLNKIIRFFTVNPYVYGFIIAMLTITPVLYLYKKVSPLPLVAVFLYVCMQTGGSSPYFMAYNQMRQALSVGIMCIAMYFYNKNNYKFNKKVILFLVLMALTHWSSLLMIIPFLLKKIKLGKFFYIIGMVVAAFAGFFAQRYVPQLSELFISMEQGFYIDEEKEFKLVASFPLLLLSCYVFFISSKEKCNSFEHKCLFLQFVLYGLLAPFNNSIFRFCVYYGVIGNLAMASSLYMSSKKNDLTIVVSTVAFLYMSYVILVSLAGMQQSYPYSWW